MGRSEPRDANGLAAASWVVGSRWPRAIDRYRSMPPIRTLLLRGLGLGVALAAGIVEATMAFSFAWGFADYLTGSSGMTTFKGGWVLLLLSVCLAFGIAGIAGWMLGSFWWLASIAVVAPPFIFLAPAMAPVTVLPLLCIGIASGCGGYVGSVWSRRIEPPDAMDSR